MRHTNNSQSARSDRDLRAIRTQSIEREKPWRADGRDRLDQ